MVQDECLDLLEGEDVISTSDASYGIMEYLSARDIVDRLELQEHSNQLTHHGHCNQKATNTAHYAHSVLEDAGIDVDMVDSTCCGMAESFGYVPDHYELSRTIGVIVFDQVAESFGEGVTVSSIL